MESALSQDSLDGLMPLPDTSEPTTPELSHVALPQAAASTASKVHAQRVDHASSGNMTPPPSTQIPSSQRAKTRTPTPPVSHISTPPPTNEQPSQTTTNRIAIGLPGAMTTGDLAKASGEELRTMVRELQVAYQEAKMAAAHHKLQYQMLAQESAANIERMAVEARMAQTENEVIQYAEQSRAAATPIPAQQEGFIPVQKELYRKMIHDIQLLREANQSLEAECCQQHATLDQQGDEISSLQDKVILMGDRIRQSREQLQRYRRSQTSSRIDATPRSVYSTPQRSHFPPRPQSQSQSQPFAALLQASEMASQESARSAGRKSHTRNVHSTSSLPSTPQRSQPVFQQPLHTPHGRRPVIKVPSTAPVQRVSALRSPDIYSQTALPVPQHRDIQSDGTVSASDNDNDSEAETDIIEQDDEIPVSQASRSASQMLRSSQEKQAKRESFEGRGMLQHAASGSQGGKLRQTKLFGSVRKANVVRAGYDDDEPPAKRPRTSGNGGIGLGISGARD